MLSAPNAGFWRSKRADRRGPPRNMGKTISKKEGSPPASAAYSMLLRKLLSRSLFGAPSTSAGAPCSQMTP